MEIIEGEEPADVVDRFTQTHSLPINYKREVISVACEKIHCNRLLPAIVKKTINDENGRVIGKVEVLEEEEVIDAVVRFLRVYKPHIDEIALKNHFFETICHIPRLKCTRNVAHVYDNNIINEDGTEIGRLILTEYDEPVDKIYDWFMERNLKEESMIFNAVEQICNTDAVICNRKVPVVFSLPMKGPEEEFIGNFEVKLNEEPVDALYVFFATHGLFEKKWDFRGVVDQVCSMSEIVCNRMVAVKFYSEKFLMGGKNVGILVVMENEEVIDKLFQTRIQFNLTAEDQMKSFGEICNKENIYCERTQAIVYKLTDITKRDFEKFGNETCSRKYAGWQFLTLFASSFMGSKASKVVKQVSIESVSKDSLKY